MVLTGISRNVKTTIVRIYGPNAAGKKMLYCWIVDLFGPENVITISSATAAWLKRKVMKGFTTKGKIFILIEDRGDPEDNLRYQFEQIYSEDRVRLGLTVKSTTGEWEPVDVELEGPLTFISTSTELEQSRHAQTRAWEVNPDESREQSRLIADWHRWRHLRSIQAKQHEEEDLAVLQACLKNLPTFTRIIVPYINQIKFDYQGLADRRKLPDFTSLLETVTYLFSDICPKDNEHGILYSVPFVYDIAVAIAGDIIAVSRGNLNRGELRVLNFVQERFNEIKSVMLDGGQAKDDGLFAEGFTVSDLCPGRPEFADIHENTMRNWLNGIVRKGHLRRTGLGRGKPAVYSLDYNMPIVNSNGAKTAPFPELGATSATELEITSSQIYEGMVQPQLTPSFRTITTLGNCELVNYRIKPEMLEFQPDWRKLPAFSTQPQVCGSTKQDGPTFLDEQIKHAIEWLRTRENKQADRSEFIPRFGAPVLEAMKIRNLVWVYRIGKNAVVVFREES
jgi:hypothetical protein